ncbi:MAG TPA: hypothetical protein VIG36_04815 [Methylocystis sp.]
MSELPARPEVENQSECAGLISGARPIYQRRAAAASAFAEKRQGLLQQSHDIAPQYVNNILFLYIKPNRKRALIGEILASRIAASSIGSCAAKLRRDSSAQASGNQ